MRFLKGTIMTEKWEYRIIHSGDMIASRGKQLAEEAAFNALGSDGWEHYYVSPTGQYYFKRRAPQASSTTRASR